MAFESEQPASAGSDPASQARAFLEAAGVRGITITGGGDSWRVSVGWNETERFVVAFSEKNAAYPNDPLFLAQEALAALIRNEGPCPHAKDEEIVSREMEPPDTDALWAPDDADDFGAEMLAAEEEEGQIPEDENAAIETNERDRSSADSGTEGSASRRVVPYEFNSVATDEQDASGDGDAETLYRVPDGVGQFAAADAAEEGLAVGVTYPGVAILSDDISIALAQVIEAVAAEEETRLAAITDLQRDDLQHQINYGNWPAGVAMDPNVEAGARRWQTHDQRRRLVIDHSLALRRSARDHRARGDLSALQAMSDGVAVGWP